MTIAPDESLPAALDALHAAVERLTDPRKECVDGAMYEAPSLYAELLREIPATSVGGDSYMTRHHRSKAPVWLDALDLRHQIDTRITTWATPDKTSRRREVSIPALLRAYASRSWRPQDSRMLTEQATELQGFALAILALLEPAHIKTLSAPCPSCEKRWVYRMHAGEQVRQPALTIIAAEGCRCQACGATWLPEHYLLLCKVLGFDLPQGIVG